MSSKLEQLLTDVEELSVEEAEDRLLPFMPKFIKIS